MSTEPIIAHPLVGELRMFGSIVPEGRWTDNEVDVNDKQLIYSQAPRTGIRL